MPTLLDPPPTDDSDLEMLCAADYPAEEVRWLWPNRIPIGKVTLLVGDPGNGKSLVALDIASRVSQGTAWPDLPPSALPLPPSPAPASVLIVSAEDDLRDTIRPRLDAAGADPQRVFVLPSIADLRHDLAKLRAALDRLPDCRLIVIDPVNSYVGPGDSHFHTIVRRVFEPLAKLAAEKGIAVLAVSHLRKHDGAAIQRAAGSIGFVAAASAVWTVCRNPERSDRYLMLQIKNNFVAQMAGLEYSISPIRLAGSCSAPSIHWRSSPVTTSAVEALQPVKKSRGPEPEEMRHAIGFLREELKNGPQPAFLITGCGQSHGLHIRTLRRALAALGGRSRKGGPWDEWQWILPEHDDEQAEPTAPEQETSTPTTATTAESASRPQRARRDPSENLSPWQKHEEFSQSNRSRGNDPRPADLKPSRNRPYPADPPSFDYESWADRDISSLSPEQLLRELAGFPPLQIGEIGEPAPEPEPFWIPGELYQPKQKLRRVEKDPSKPYLYTSSGRCRAP